MKDFGRVVKESKTKGKKLGLFVHKNSLEARYGDVVVLRLCPNGKLIVPTCKVCINALEEWLNEGKHCRGSVVPYKEKEYYISRDHSLRADIAGGNIFNFEYALQHMACEDDNVLRRANGTPIIFN